MLYLLNFTVIRYDQGFQLGLIAFTAAVMGGIGNLTGALLGAVIIGMIEALNEGLTWMTPGSDWTRLDGLRPADRDPRLPTGGPARRANTGGRMRAPRASARAGRREAWDRMPTWLQRFGPGIVFGVLAFLYPYYVDSLPGAFPSVQTAVIMLVFTMMAIGLNIVVGYAGLLDLGYVAFYAVGRTRPAWFASLHFEQTTLHLGSVGVNPDAVGIHFSFWLILPIAGTHGARRDPDRPADAAPAWRLPGDRHARLRRDHPAGRPQRRQLRRLQPDERHVRHQPDRLAGLRRAAQRPGRPARLVPAVVRPRRVVLLDGRGADPVHDLLLDPAARLAARARVDRDPRGRDGRRGHGRAADADEDVVVRDRRVLRRRGGRATTRASRAPRSRADFYFNISVFLLCMVVLGGMGSVWGVLVGGLFLTWLDQEGLAKLGNWVSDTLDRQIDVPKYNFGVYGSDHRADDALPADRADPERRRKRELEEGVHDVAALRRHARGRAHRPARTKGLRGERGSPRTADLLVATKMRKEFGGLVATNDVDFTIPRGSVVSLIGPNGAGKTTFFNMLTGVYKPTAGQIVFDGTDVTGKPPHAITKLGIGRTFQNIRLFPADDRARERPRRHARGPEGRHLRLDPAHAARAARGARAEAASWRASCSATRACRAGTTRWRTRLPYGDQRRLEVARALATDPKLLLLDEPTAGMNPQETADFIGFVDRGSATSAA